MRDETMKTNAADLFAMAFVLIAGWFLLFQSNLF